MRDKSPEHRASDMMDVIRAVLSAPELRFGNPRVECLNEKLEARLGINLPKTAPSFFLLSAEGLSSLAHELIILRVRAATEEEERSQQSTLLKAALKLAQPCSCVSVVSTSGDDIAFMDQEACSIERHTPSTFLEKLLPVPQDFKSRLQDAASVEGADKFKNVFQPRFATLQSTPFDKVSAGQQRSRRGETFSLDGYLEEWLAARFRAAPILLLGERGTGKSWQLLRFAQQAYELHCREPWKYGPAFFVDLRGLVREATDSSAARTVVADYLTQKYFSGSAVKVRPAFPSPILSAGYPVVCVDGFDEHDVLPSDEKVQPKFTQKLLLLSRRTRFVLTSRAEHFTSLRSLLALGAGLSTTVESMFEILQMCPFEPAQAKKYVSAAMSHGDSQNRLHALFEREQEDPVFRALSICAGHPAVLARIVDVFQGGEERPLHLINDALMSVFIRHNLERGRTRSAYEGTDLSVQRRYELLGEVAWHMAERRCDTVDFARLPARLRLAYGLESDVLQRDIRSQTVMEFAPKGDPGGARANGAEGTDSAAREVTRDEHRASYRRAGEVDSEPEPPASLVRFTLRVNDERGVGDGEPSVAGAYFLAWHVLRRLKVRGPTGEVPLAVRLAALGLVEIGPMAGALLREMMDGEEEILTGSALGRMAWKHLRGLARKGDLQVFLPAYRFLADNLVQIGGLTAHDAALLSPWTGDTTSVVRSPSIVPDYEMVLVPPPGGSSVEPFLLGVHEVTNEQYLSFVLDSSGAVGDDPIIVGPEWSVSRMTIAGSTKDGDRRDVPPSPNHARSNEYHLFFWLPNRTAIVQPRVAEERSTGGSMQFLPPQSIRQHPVTYVSWYAAAAYCDWLSHRMDGLERYYSPNWARGIEGRSEDADHRGALGYRLPKRDEWTLAARCGHLDVDHPWDLCPYYLPKETRAMLEDGAEQIEDREASEAFKKSQRIMRLVLLETGKGTRPVLYDERNEFGLSGLVGNVREWCDDRQVKGSDEYRLILGATGYLGEQTFDFEYQTPLFPRNTNPDVGFRVARTLGQADERTLRRRETELANLPDEPPNDLKSFR